MLETGITRPLESGDRIKVGENSNNCTHASKRHFTTRGYNSETIEYSNLLTSVTTFNKSCNRKHYNSHSQ